MSWKNDQVSENETKRILELARGCLGVEGDFVEMGCYKGDTSLLLAELLVKNSVGNGVDKSRKSGEKVVEKDCGGLLRKRLWIYDSFEGLPEKNSADESVLGADFKEGELFVTKREVKERFLRAGLPVPVIKKAWFCDLGAEDLPEKIAFAFLDGDFYESIRDSLKLVGPKMSKDGVIIVHDYTNPALPGVKKAVDEWAKGRELEYKLVLL
ncbi:class I SAM-dependent methyltransferase [Candidatus Saccharibacteria bacterium]|nr:class I SAM-dependent methyltransferase [Candidatus Saccharibacteria bacterium]